MANEKENYINQSLSIILLCDSKDARKIVEETLISLFLKYGVVIAPSFHSQRAVVESSLSLGLVERSFIRNVKTEVAKALIGGEMDGDA